METLDGQHASFQSRIAGFQAIVSETAQKADAQRQSVGGVAKAASFVQKMKGMWLDRQAAVQVAEQGSAGAPNLRSQLGASSPSPNNAAKPSPHWLVDGAQRKSPGPEPGMCVSVCVRVRVCVCVCE
jgi:hypothetical protein